MIVCPPILVKFLIPRLESRQNYIFICRIRSQIFWNFRVFFSECVAVDDSNVDIFDDGRKRETRVSNCYMFYCLYWHGWFGDFIDILFNYYLVLYVFKINKYLCMLFFVVFIVIIIIIIMNIYSRHFLSRAIKVNGVSTQNMYS